MHYEVRVVEDHQLPPQTPWALVTLEDSSLMFIKRSVMNTDAARLAGVLTVAWSTWMATGASTALSAALALVS